MEPHVASCVPKGGEVLGSEGPVSARAGEIARENAVYRCESCERRMPVHSGVPIEDCPDCGHPSFQTGLASQPRPAEAVINGMA